MLPWCRTSCSPKKGVAQVNISARMHKLRLAPAPSWVFCYSLCYRATPRLSRGVKNFVLELVEPRGFEPLTS